MKDEIQLIISGKSPVKHGDFIQTVLSYLNRSQATSTVAKEDKYFKKEETKRLKNFAEENNLIVTSINLDNYISQGAEQKVYLKDGSTVVKLNDAIYYNSWVDYLHNLLLNNYFFPDTAYNLLGFFESGETLFAVISQPFVKATEKTDLGLVKEFM